MTLVNIAHQDLAESTTTLMASGIVGKLFSEITKFQFKPVDENWFFDLLEVMQFSTSVEIGYSHARSYVLAIIEQHWEELPIEVRSKYGFTFNTFAQTVTGKERSTISNYVRTAKIWFIDQTKPAFDVKIADRDEKGKIIPNQFHYESFTPYKIDHSKLQLVNHRATKGEMTPKLWEILVDPFYSCQELATACSSETYSNGEMPDSYFTAEGPGLFYTSGIETVCVTEELNWTDYDNNSLVKEAVDKLLKILDVSRDEDVLFNEYKRGLNGTSTT